MILLRRALVSFMPFPLSRCCADSAVVCVKSFGRCRAKATRDVAGAR